MPAPKDHRIRPGIMPPVFVPENVDAEEILLERAKEQALKEVEDEQEEEEEKESELKRPASSTRQAGSTKSTSPEKTM